LYKTSNDQLLTFYLHVSLILQYLTDVEFCWRLSKSTYQVSKIEESMGNKDRQKELTYEAKNLAEKAVKLDDNCANAHKW